MSEQEEFLMSDPVSGQEHPQLDGFDIEVDPAIEGSDRTIRVEISIRDLVSQEMLDQWREMVNRGLSSNINPAYQAGLNLRDAIQRGIDRQFSAGYQPQPPSFNTTHEAIEQLTEIANRFSPEPISQEAIDHLNQLAPELRDGIRRSLDRLTTPAIRRTFYLDEEEINQVQQYDATVQLLRDRMLESHRLPAKVLFDSAPGRQIPPETIAQRLSRSNLYESITPQRPLEQRPGRESPKQPVACVGCKHYDGNIYGKNQLICGMYPYGPEADTCSDREAWPEDSWREALKSHNWRTALDFSDRQVWLNRVEELAIERDRLLFEESALAVMMLDRIRIGAIAVGSLQPIEINAVLAKVRAES